MKVSETSLKDAFIIEPKVFGDHRGYFLESFNEGKWSDVLGKVNWVQDNQSFSAYGTLRRLHLQLGPFAQAKLVRVVKGKVLDVIVDLRKDSPSFGKHLAVELSEENHLQLFVPRGFAHGFVVLSPEALFLYKCDNYYAPQAESGIHYADESLNIDWKVHERDIIISDKDKVLPSLSQFKEESL